MKPTRRLLFIVTANFIVFMMLLAGLAIVPPAAIDLYRWVKKAALKNNATLHLDPRSELPNYRNHVWTRKHFDEFSKLQTNYYDFIIWRREEFRGETINIDKDGYRRHQLGEQSTPSNAAVWLFGGSSMFGTGVADSDTIPAYLQRKTGLLTFNFGEFAYT